MELSTYEEIANSEVFSMYLRDNGLARIANLFESRIFDEHHGRPEAIDSVTRYEWDIFKTMYGLLQRYLAYGHLDDLNILRSYIAQHTWNIVITEELAALFSPIPFSYDTA